MHFRYTETDSWTAPYVKPQLPLVFDLTSDPHETVDLLGTRREMGWVVDIGFVELANFQASVAKSHNFGAVEEIKDDY